METQGEQGGGTGMVNRGGGTGWRHRVNRVEAQGGDRVNRVEEHGEQGGGTG